VARERFNLKMLKLMLINTLVLFLLAACGGGGGSDSNSVVTVKSNTMTGVAQKGPFSVGSKVMITQLDSSGLATANVIESSVSKTNGRFSFTPDSLDINAYYLLEASGRFLDESTGSISENEISLSAITKTLEESSINLATHWISQRAKMLIGNGKSVAKSVDQSQQELYKVFGINHSNVIDVTSDLSSLDQDNALLLLLSGALMEASATFKVNPQTIVDDIAEDFAMDGQLNEKGDDWFLKLQSLIKDNPSFHTQQFSKTITDKLGYKVSLENKLPAVIPLSSRPVAILASELIAIPGETITLDGSESHDSGNIINFTWFRVDQQTQYDIQVSNRFLASPTVTLPNEEVVLASPNQEIALLYALVVTDEDKLTHTATVKVNVRIPSQVNSIPVANSQTLTTNEDLPLAITLDATDEDGDSIQYVLNTPLATPNGLVELDPAMGSSLPNIIYTPNPNYSGPDSFTFFVNDDFASSDIATIDIQVNPVNDPPLADAGNNQTIESLQVVTLNGSGTDIDGTIDAYLWQQTNGSPVNLSDSAIANPSFTAPYVIVVYDTLSFDLVVTDNNGADSIADSVDIEISPVNLAPIANAGQNQTVTALRT